MKFTFISLLYIVLGVKCSHNEGNHYRGEKPLQSYDVQSKSPPRRKIWSDEVFTKFRDRPLKHPVYENRGPALFPQEQPFPPGGPSILTPIKGGGSQIYKVGSSLNFNGNSAKVGNRQGVLRPFGGGSFGIGSVETVDPFQGESVGATSSGFSQGVSSIGGLNQGDTFGYQGSFENGRPQGSFSSSGINQNFGAINSQNGFSEFNSYPGFGLYPSKYESALAKNPLFLVLKLLITEPGLWVTSPVLYHGLAHTGIVKPFPRGFGIYGYRFANNVPNSQVYGNGNIIHDNP